MEILLIILLIVGIYLYKKENEIFKNEKSKHRITVFDKFNKMTIHINVCKFKLNKNKLYVFTKNGNEKNVYVYNLTYIYSYSIEDN